VEKTLADLGTDQIVGDDEIASIVEAAPQEGENATV
jgi:hypothetical protein